MRAPFFPVPFDMATAELPLRFASDFARLTSCEVPNESAAGLFSPDMVSSWVSKVVLAAVRGWTCVACTLELVNFREVRRASALSHRSLHQRPPRNSILTTPT